jgi:hypothetical protein
VPPAHAGNDDENCDDRGETENRDRGDDGHGNGNGRGKRP